MIDLQNARAVAFSYGAEAAANQRRNMIKADREELAQAYGVSEWREIPTSHQESLIDAFWAGFKSERSYEI